MPDVVPRCAVLQHGAEVKFDDLRGALHLRQADALELLLHRMEAAGDQLEAEDQAELLTFAITQDACQCLEVRCACLRRHRLCRVLLPLPTSQPCAQVSPVRRLVFIE
jgi:hypothetical protein